MYPTFFSLMPRTDAAVIVLTAGLVIGVLMRLVG